MSERSSRTDKASWETTHGRFLRRSISHVRTTRLALALSAALLSPLAVDAMAATTTAVKANPNSPQGDPLTVVNCNDSGAGSLRDIIDNVAQSGDTVDLRTLPLVCGTITLTTGEIVVAQNDLTLRGRDWENGAVTISGAGASRVFHHTGAGTLAVQGLTLADGYYRAAGDAYGGCVFSNGENITLNRAAVTRCTVLSDTGFASGGGVAAYSGNVALV